MSTIDHVSTAEDAVLKRDEENAEAINIIRQREEIMQSRENSKVDWRNKIAEDVDAKKQLDPFEEREEIEDVLPLEEHDEIANKVDETSEDEKLITKVVNGKEVSLTYDQWMERAIKVSEADEYYADAARNRYKPEQQDVSQVEDPEDFDEISKAIQLGSPEEARDALKNLQNSAVKKAKNIMTQEQVQIAAQAAYKAVVRDYKELVEDPILNGAFIALDKKLLDENKTFSNDPVENFDLRMRFAGDEIRKWQSSKLGNAGKEKEKEILLEKKKNIHTLPRAGTKKIINSKSPLSEEQQKQADIRSMFAKRAGSVLGRRG